jgi:hypothetical protein
MINTDTNNKIDQIRLENPAVEIVSDGSIVKPNGFQNLEDHIDEPIKKCVAGMALLGFNPIMSCCGFNYKGEKVPKKHLEKAYLYLNGSSLNEKNSLILMKIAKESGWTIKPLFGSGIIDFFAETWAKTHPWNVPGCPHFHEVFVIAINYLERAINNHKNEFPKEGVKITDGNEMYKEVHKYWQYEPTNSWVVTPEIYEKL